MFIMSSIDAAIAAESLGLGMCYVGAIRNNAQQVAELLNLPPLTLAIFGMAIGYPCAHDPPQRSISLWGCSMLNRGSLDV